MPAKQWSNWPDIAQRVFNEMYGTMVANQTLFLHPKTPWMYQEQWSTTSWNTAWTAADACQQALKDIIAGRGYAKK
mgnify:FL=1